MHPPLHGYQNERLINVHLPAFSQSPRTLAEQGKFDQADKSHEKVLKILASTSLYKKLEKLKGQIKHNRHTVALHPQETFSECQRRKKFLNTRKII